MSSSRETFHQLHQSGTFLLVNVHDAGTAVVAEAAGAVALGTSSAGHAYSIGRTDGQGAITRHEAIERAAQICASVRIPVSVDAENGWGHSPDEVAATIADLADAGAAGASIEDWSGDPTIGFYDRSQAQDRVLAAVETARSLPEPFVLCARAEALLYQSHLEAGSSPLQEAVARLQTFAKVGADCLYAPGLRTRPEFTTVAAEAGGPINGLIGLGSDLTMDDARQLGIRRVSVGGSLFRATMAAFQSQVRRLIDTGSFSVDPPPLTDAELRDLMPDHR